MVTGPGLDLACSAHHEDTRLARGFHFPAGRLCHPQYHPIHTLSVLSFASGHLSSVHQDAGDATIVHIPHKGAHMDYAQPTAQTTCHMRPGQKWSLGASSSHTNLLECHRLSMKFREATKEESFLQSGRMHDMPPAHSSTPPHPWPILRMAGRGTRALKNMSPKNSWLL